MNQETNIQCIGFIMDGNRRWAKAQGLPTLEGHKKGAETFQQTVEWARDKRIPHVVFYAFSTENWKRSEREVEYLMRLFKTQAKKVQEQLVDMSADDGATKGVRFKVVGQKDDFSQDIQTQIADIEAQCAGFVESSTTVWVALSYGGRAEIVQAVNQAVDAGNVLSEEDFGQKLWTAAMPDLDLIVRTGGEKRLSNFMTWKSVYSELVFLDKNWPDLTNGDLDEVLQDYQERQRRFGK
jgi:undecaprenyl diphosphate synthase